MGPNASSETERRSATHAAVTRTHSGSLRERGAPGGDRNGESVSTRTRSSGTRAATSPEASSPRRNTRPENEIARPEVDHRPTVVHRPRIRVDDGRRAVAERRGPPAVPHPGRPQLGEECVLRVASALGRAAVEDGRLAGLEREREVAPQVAQLVRDRAEDTVVVEPGLADGHDALVERPGRDRSPRLVVHLGRVVRVDADRGVEPRIAVDQRQCPLGRGRVPARHEDPLDAGEAGTADDEVGVALEPIGVEVAVAVDQGHPRMVWLWQPGPRVAARRLATVTSSSHRPLGVALDRYQSRAARQSFGALGPPVPRCHG